MHTARPRRAAPLGFPSLTPPPLPRSQLTHLDGRTLLIKSQPTEENGVIRPVAYNPFKEEEEADWDLFDDCDCPSLENAAVAETDDVTACKKACEKGQLKGKGIGAFVQVTAAAAAAACAAPTPAPSRCARDLPADRLPCCAPSPAQRGGKTVFKQCTHAEAIAAKSPAKGAKMFIIGDPEASANLRLMQAVEGEGLPRLKSPFEHGNLFLILNIEFPTTLPAAAAAQLLKVLPPPKHVPTVSEDSDDVEVVTLKAIDPVKSYKEHLAAQPEPDDDDDDDGPGGQRVQCAQQ